MLFDLPAKNNSLEKSHDCKCLCFSLSSLRRCQEKAKSAVVAPAPKVMALLSDVAPVSRARGTPNALPMSAACKARK